MKTSTFVSDANGLRELINYDKMRDWIEQMKVSFENDKEFSGYPRLPEKWLEWEEIYNKASDEEKRLIIISIFGNFIEALRHWRADRVELYGKDSPFPRY